MTLKNRVDRVQRQMDQADAQRAESLLRDFAASLAPEHRAILRDVLDATRVTGLENIPDDELDWLSVSAIPDHVLARILALAPKYALPGHQRPFEEWNWHIEDSKPGPDGMKGWTPEYKALVDLQVELTNELKPR